MYILMLSCLSLFLRFFLSFPPDFTHQLASMPHVRIASGPSLVVSHSPQAYLTPSIPSLFLASCLLALAFLMPPSCLPRVFPLSPAGRVLLSPNVLDFTCRSSVSSCLGSSVA